MPAIRVQRTIPIPAPLVYAALGDILKQIAAQDDAFRGFPLHVDLIEAGLPDVGYIAVPIALTTEPAAADLTQFDVSISAAHDPAAFPVFKGAMGVDVLGPGAASLWLDGDYGVPAAAAGRFLDATLLRGVAARALENLVDDLERACRALIDKREAEYVRRQHVVH